VDNEFDNQFEEALQKLADCFAPEEALPAVETGAKLVQARAKSLAPVRTGAMRNTIITQSSIEDGEAVAEVIATSPYAGFVEFGTGPKGAASAKILPDGMDMPASKYKDTGWFLPPDIVKATGIHYTTGQPAQPFMMPAILSEQEKLKKVVGKSVTAILSRLYGGGGGG